MLMIDLFLNVIIYVDSKQISNKYFNKLNHLPYIIKNLMQMNNDYIYIYSEDFLHDRIDDDHVLISMSRFVDNDYNKKLEILMIDVEELIDVKLFVEL